MSTQLNDKFVSNAALRIALNGVKSYVGSNFVDTSSFSDWKTNIASGATFLNGSTVNGKIFDHTRTGSSVTMVGRISTVAEDGTVSYSENQSLWSLPMATSAAAGLMSSDMYNTVSQLSAANFDKSTMVGVTTNYSTTAQNGYGIEFLIDGNGYDGTKQTQYQIAGITSNSPGENYILTVGGWALTLHNNSYNSIADVSDTNKLYPYSGISKIGNSWYISKQLLGKTIPTEFNHNRTANSVTMMYKGFKFNDTDDATSPGTYSDVDTWTSLWSMPMATTSMAGFMSASDKSWINDMSYYDTLWSFIKDESTRPWGRLESDARYITLLNPYLYYDYDTGTLQKEKGNASYMYAMIPVDGFGQQSFTYYKTDKVRLGCYTGGMDLFGEYYPWEINVATTSQCGVMSATDKTNLDDAVAKVASLEAEIASLKTTLGEINQALLKINGLSTDDETDDTL